MQTISSFNVWMHKQIRTCWSHPIVQTCFCFLAVGICWIAAHVSHGFCCHSKSTDGGEGDSETQTEMLLCSCLDDSSLSQWPLSIPLHFFCSSTSPSSSAHFCPPAGFTVAHLLCFSSDHTWSVQPFHAVLGVSFSRAQLEFFLEIVVNLFSEWEYCFSPSASINWIKPTHYSAETLIA